ncbi:MAG: transposase [Thermaerobacter sp.]|nr:transposase [Thermaerobacter sp.]
MLEALIAGSTDAPAMAGLAKGRLKAKRAALIVALTGLVGSHQRFWLQELLAHIDEWDRHLSALDREIRVLVAAYVRGSHRPLGFDSGDRPPSGRSDLSRNRPRRAPLARCGSFGGLAPGQNESAGKRRPGRLRKGNVTVRSALILAAWAASHTKRTFLSALNHRWARRMPPKKAIAALAHRLLVSIYPVIRIREPYRDLGVTYHDQRDRRQIVQRTPASPPGAGL